MLILRKFSLKIKTYKFMKKLFLTLSLVILGFASSFAQTGNGAVYRGVESFVHHQEMSTPKDFPYTLDYEITWLENGHLNVKASMIWGENGAPVGAVDNMYIDVSGEPSKEYSTTRINGDITTVSTFKLGNEVSITFRVAATDGDIVKAELKYVVGSSSEPEGDFLKLTAYADDITLNSAKIYYDISLPEGYENATVSVKCNEDNVSDSPIILNNLLENTSYEYTLSATAEVSGKETLTSDDVIVSFKTLRDPNNIAHNYQIVNGFISNAIYTGESESERRPLPVTFKSDIYLNPDNTLTVNFTTEGFSEILGSVAQLNINGVYSSAERLFREGNNFEYVTKQTFEEGETISIFYYPQFNGTTGRLDLKNFKAGEANAPIEYGEPVEPKLYVEKTELHANEPQSFCAYLVDENGNFILSQKPSLQITNNSAEAELNEGGYFITLKDQGEATLEASFGGKSITETFYVLHSPNTTNIVSGIIPTLCEDGEDAANATDGNEDSWTTFSCAERQDHTLSLDFGKSYIVELITLIWEGASASEYSVALYKEDPSTSEPVALFNITNGEGGSGLTIRKNIFVENVEAKYAVITTSKAFEPGWNIKLKEIEVYGAPAEEVIPTSISFEAETHLSYNEPAVVRARLYDQYEIEIPADNFKFYINDQLVQESGNTLSLNLAEYGYTEGYFAVTASAGKVQSDKLYIYVDGTENNKISASETEYTIKINGNEIAKKFDNEINVSDGLTLNSTLELIFEDTFDFNLIKLKWEAACPSDYTVTAVDFNGNERTILSVAGRGFVLGVNPIDRIYTEDNTVSAKRNVSGSTDNLNSIKSLRITPTAKDHDYELRLLGMELYGTPSELAYYLVGESLTLGMDRNPSFKFIESTETEGLYTLEVASIKANEEFVIKGTDGSFYSYDAGAFVMDPQNNEYSLTTDENKGKMSFSSTYLNVNFRFYPATATLQINAIEDNSADWIVNYGNDKTNQSGIFDKETNTHIITITTDLSQTGCLIYIYAPNDASKVYYSLSIKNKENLKSYAPEGAFSEVSKASDGSYPIALPVGDGSVVLQYENQNGEISDNIHSFNYSVTRSVPTGLETVECNDALVDVFTLSGMKVASQVNFDDIRASLAPGLYIVGKKKVIIR